NFRGKRPTLYSDEVWSGSQPKFSILVERIRWNGIRRVSLDTHLTIVLLSSSRQPVAMNRAIPFSDQKKRLQTRKVAGLFNFWWRKPIHIPGNRLDPPNPRQSQAVLAAGGVSELS